MKNYEISEKEEFLALLSYLEKMMRVDPDRLIKSPDYGEKVQRFNSLVTLVPTFRLSQEEKAEVDSLWSSLKQNIEKRTKRRAEMSKMTEGELLLQTIAEIIKKWGRVSKDELKRMIDEVNRLQSDPRVVAGMSEEQIEEYRRSMNVLRKMTEGESVGSAGHVNLGSNKRRRF